MSTDRQQQGLGNQVWGVDCPSPGGASLGNWQGCQGLSGREEGQQSTGGPQLTLPHQTAAPQSLIRLARPKGGCAHRRPQQVCPTLQGYSGQLGDMFLWRKRPGAHRTQRQETPWQGLLRKDLLFVGGRGTCLCQPWALAPSLSPAQAPRGHWTWRPPIPKTSGAPMRAPWGASPGPGTSTLPRLTLVSAAC